VAHRPTQGGIGPSIAGMDAVASRADEAARRSSG
jgi:hypothetical protein